MTNSKGNRNAYLTFGELRASVDRIIIAANKKQRQVHRHRFDLDAPEYTQITKEFDNRIYKYMEKHNIALRSQFLRLIGLTEDEADYYHNVTSAFCKRHVVRIKTTVFKKILEGLEEVPKIVPPDIRQHEYPKDTVTHIMCLARDGMSYKRIAEQVPYTYKVVEKIIHRNSRRLNKTECTMIRDRIQKGHTGKSVRVLLRLTPPEFNQAK